MTVTHVDTSTGVLAPWSRWRRPRASTASWPWWTACAPPAGEAFHQDAWGADVYLTASQKAVGVPPGLALLTVSPRALAAWKARKAPVASVYRGLGGVAAGHGGLRGRQARLLRHPAHVPGRARWTSAWDRSSRRAWRPASSATAAWPAPSAPRGARWACACSPPREAVAANTLSAVYYPDGVDASLVGRVKAAGRGHRRRPPPGDQDALLPRGPHEPRQRRGRARHRGRHRARAPAPPATAPPPPGRPSPPPRPRSPSRTRSAGRDPHVVS